METQYTAGFSAPTTQSGVDELPRGGLHHRLHPRGKLGVATRVQAVMKATSGQLINP